MFKNRFALSFVAVCLTCIAGLAYYKANTPQAVAQQQIRADQENWHQQHLIMDKLKDEGEIFNASRYNIPPGTHLEYDYESPFSGCRMVVHDHLTVKRFYALPEAIREWQVVSATDLTVKGHYRQGDKFKEGMFMNTEDAPTSETGIVNANKR